MRSERTGKVWVWGFGVQAGGGGSTAGDLCWAGGRRGVGRDRGAIEGGWPDHCPDPMIMAAWGRSGDPHFATSGQSLCVTCVQVPGTDLDGNGFQLTDLTRSTVFMEGDEGLKHRTAWAGAGDGVLFYDTETIGQAGFNEISDIREYVFTEWDPTAKDDLAALRSRFDARDLNYAGVSAVIGLICTMQNRVLEPGCQGRDSHRRVKCAFASNQKFMERFRRDIMQETGEKK